MAEKHLCEKIILNQDWKSHGHRGIERAVEAASEIPKALMHGPLAPHSRNTKHLNGTGVTGAEHRTTAASKAAGDIHLGEDR
jgi:hypothetical protein